MSTSHDGRRVARTGTFRGVRDLRLVARQVFYEQLSFWLNPIGAAFTVVFSVVFLVLAGSHRRQLSASRTWRTSALVVYYVPGFAAYGVMAACFNLLTIQLVIRREMGLLKRLRLSPLPTWVMLGAIFGNALIISLRRKWSSLVLIGRFGYNVAFPHNPAAFVVALDRRGGCASPPSGSPPAPGSQPGSGRPDGEHRVLRAAVPVGTVVPDQERRRGWPSSRGSSPSGASSMRRSIRSTSQSGFRGMGWTTSR